MEASTGGSLRGRIQSHGTEVGALDVMFFVHEEHSMCSEVVHAHTTTKKMK